MNTKDIRTSSDPDFAGSYAAMERAACSAQDLAIKTNTGIVVAVDGKNVELTAADLIKLRDKEAPVSLPPESGSHNEMHNLVCGRISDEKDKGAVYAGI